MPENFNSLLLINSWIQEGNYPIKQGSNKYFRIACTAITDRITNDSLLCVRVSINPDDFPTPSYVGDVFRFRLKLTCNGETVVEENGGGYRWHVDFVRTAQGMLLQPNSLDGGASDVIITIYTWVENARTHIVQEDSAIKPVTHHITIPGNKFPTNPFGSIATIDNIRSETGGFRSFYSYTEHKDYRVLAGRLEYVDIFALFDLNPIEIPFPSSRNDDDDETQTVHNPRIYVTISDNWKTSLNNSVNPEDSYNYVKPNVFQVPVHEDFSAQDFPIDLFVVINNWTSCGISGKVVSGVTLFRTTYIFPAAVEYLTIDQFSYMLIDDGPKKINYTLHANSKALGEIANKEVTFKTSNSRVCSVSSDGIITPFRAGTCIITVTSTDNTFHRYEDSNIYPEAKLSLFISDARDFPYFKLNYDYLNVFLMRNIILALNFLEAKEEYADHEHYKTLQFNGYAHDVRTIFELLTDAADNIDLFNAMFVEYYKNNMQYRKLFEILYLHYREKTYYVKETNENVTWPRLMEFHVADDPGSILPGIIIISQPDKNYDVPSWYAAINSLIECLQIIGNVYEYPNSLVDGCYVDSAYVDRELEEP